MSLKAPIAPIDPQADIPPTPQVEIDRALDTLASHKDEWAVLPVKDRRAILSELIRDFAAVAPRWAEAARQGERIPPGTPTAGEEWLVGPYFIERNLQLLDRALADIEKHGVPRVPGPVTERPDGKTVARAFPQTVYDRVFFTGITADVWMQDGVTPENLASTQAIAYQGDASEGAVSLVLSAGNVTGIGPTDVLYKLFVDNQVVVYKTHPLNAYLGTLFAEGFQALIDWGVLRIVDGDAEVGAYLCTHPHVDEIHVTGSDKTVEAIVFGPGDAGQARKAARRPQNTRPITSELGNVSPVIVVPGPWSESDVDYHGESLVSMLVNNAGFNCNATRVIITHDAWPQREALLDRVRHHLGRTPTRHAYYPGAHDRHAAFVEAHPEAERFGAIPNQGHLPWTFIPNVDARNHDDICFNTESFCGVFAETSLAGSSVIDYIENAVAFANDRVWGTLNITMLVHPASLGDPGVAEAVDQAIERLRYGTISINTWAATNYGLMITPWGAFPGHDIYDIQSGTGVVHNTLMFSRVEKTVVRAPWRIVPKPLFFPSHKTTLAMSKKLAAFEANPSPFKVPGIFWSAIRG